MHAFDQRCAARSRASDIGASVPRNTRQPRLKITAEKCVRGFPELQKHRLGHILRFAPIVACSPSRPNQSSKLQIESFKIIKDAG